jgi:hypothetical protein
MELSYVFLLLGIVSLTYAGILHFFISAHTEKDLENPIIRRAHNQLLTRQTTAIWIAGMFIFTAIPLIVLKM